MSRFTLILPLSLVAFCLAQEDSGLYVNRIKIETFHNNQGNDKTFTYYVADSHHQEQLNDYKTAAGSIGSLYEDDYAADSATCTTSECPKLRRVYAHMITTDGKKSTRIIDSALKASTGASTAKPIGFVAPYPGYCSSNDVLPIIEMYSEDLKQYAYWSPAQPEQLTNVASTTLDKSRYIPKRLVGYALSADPERLVLENKTPDFVKPIGKSNYTHSFFPAWQLVEYAKGDNLYILGQPTTVDKYVAASAGAPGTLKNLGVFLLGKMTAKEFTALDKICGERTAVITGRDSTSKYTALFAPDVTLGYTGHGPAGWVFKYNRPACGGLKGLALLKELKHKTKSNHFTYAVDPVQIQALISTGVWEETPKKFGYAPLDKIGFVLVNAIV